MTEDTLLLTVTFNFLFTISNVKIRWTLDYGSIPAVSTEIWHSPTVVKTSATLLRKARIGNTYGERWDIDNIVPGIVNTVPVDIIHFKRRLRKVLWFLSDHQKGNSWGLMEVTLCRQFWTVLIKSFRNRWGNFLFYLHVKFVTFDTVGCDPGIE